MLSQIDSKNMLKFMYLSEMDIFEFKFLHQGYNHYLSALKLSFTWAEDFQMFRLRKEIVSLSKIRYNENVSCIEKQSFEDSVTHNELIDTGLVVTFYDNFITFF